MMNPLKKLYCRAFQLAFRLALPILPYREPKQLDGLDSIPPLLEEKGVPSVLLVTDGAVRSLGLAQPLEKALASCSIRCAVYDGVVPNPTIQNVEEARRLYLEARRAMLRAAYCAGVSFTRSYVGYIHGLAHSLGGRYGVAHGLANAVILPCFLEEYGPVCWEKLGRLAKAAGLARAEDGAGQSAKAFIAWIREANRTMGIPDSIPEIQVRDIPEMARHAAQESNPLYPVPRLMDREELEAVYLKLMPKEVTLWTSSPLSRPSAPISKPEQHSA